MFTSIDKPTKKKVDKASRRVKERCNLKSDQQVAELYTMYLHTFSSLLLEILFETKLPHFHFQQAGATEEEGQWEAKEAETEREEKEDSRTCGCVSARGGALLPKDARARARTHAQTRGLQQH